MKRHSKLFLFSLLSVSVLACAIAFTDCAYATEGGGGAYANGSEDFMTGVLPPPGTYFINYLNYYTASRFNDGGGNSMLSNFSVDVVADVLRLVHVTNYKILGADWAFHALLPMVDQKVRMPFAQNDSRTGLGNLVIDPLILGWHWKNFHVIAGPDIIIPTGTYDKDELANPGRNYWTFEPVVAVTFLSDEGIELSGKFMYDFNTKNQDTNYLSGQEFHFDYTVGYHIKKWAFGLGGYYYQQTTDDELNGTKVGDDGFKGKVFALGPQVSYDYKNMSLTFKWQPERDAENRPEGNNLWFKFMYAF
ncbi:MAG: transporter [Syntrophales bacterium]|jgi:hypothetical protein